MDNRPQRAQRTETVLLLLAFALLLWASPFFHWWATAERAWYLPYLVWGVLIGLIYLCQRCRWP